MAQNNATPGCGWRCGAGLGRDDLKPRVVVVARVNIGHAVGRHRPAGDGPQDEADLRDLEEERGLDIGDSADSHRH